MTLTPEQCLAQGHEITRQYLVGFIGVDDASQERLSRSLGSGTLVSLGGVRGILTAAHVVSELRRQKQLGIMRFRNGLPESMVFDTAYVDYLALGEDTLGDHGPDIGFVKLPGEVEATLAATNVFFSPDAHGDAMSRRAGQPQMPEARFVAGVLDHFTTVLPPEGVMHRVEYTSLIGWGEIVERGKMLDGHDWFTFALAFDEGVAPPPSYGGVSGGAVWQLMDEDPPLHRNVVGVPFRQGPPDADGHRLITCHGPHSIYEKLLPEIARKWNPQAWAAWQAESSEEQRDEEARS